MNTLSVLFTTVIPSVSIVFMLCLTLGGLFAFRKGYFKQLGENSKQAGETQEKTINAQGALINTLNTRVDSLEKEVAHLLGVIETTKDLLAQKGITLIISGEMVTIDGANGKPSSIRRKPRPTPKKDTP